LHGNVVRMFEHVCSWMTDVGRYEKYERFEVRPTRRGFGVFDTLMDGFAHEDLWVESATREVEWSNKGQLKARPLRPSRSGLMASGFQGTSRPGP
jgi:hypothetical protein